MACWWVFQNYTYEEESKGSFLWAPKIDKGGNIPHHWKTMSLLKEGDIVFSCVNQKIVAISSVVTDSYDYTKPFDKSWEEDGLKADLIFTELENPIELAPIVDTLMPMMNSKYAPLNRKGTGNQGYLYHISDVVGEYLISLTENSNAFLIEEKELEDIQLSNTIKKTTKKALVESRIGQGKFRDDLLQYWDGKCAVTGLDVPKLLKASHTKPWKYSNNQERLDPNNGILLSPNYDEAFDKGFISFDDNGRIVLSQHLTKESINALGFNHTDKIQKVLTTAQKKYLEYHRSERLI